MWFYSYTPILILQGFCLYHAFKNHNDQRWFYLIIFLPLVGSLVYLYYHFSGRIDVGNITESMKGMVNSNYNIQKMEKELAFADTFNNRIRLADMYLDNGMADKAIDLYQSCLQGVNADDPYLLSKLVRAFFIKKDYAAAVKYGDMVRENKEFKKSQERVAYAWALYYQNQSQKAFEEFGALDMPYSNFPQRVEYVRFLIEVGQKDHAKSLIKELSNEYRLAEGLERKLKRPYYGQLKELESKI